MDRSIAIRKFREQGGKVVGVLPGRYPRTILAAADVLAVEMWDPPGSVGVGARHIQPFVCSVVQRALSVILRKSGDLDAILAPHLCDSVQNLFTIVRDCLPVSLPSLMFYPPRNIRTEGAVDYVTAQLRTLAEQLVDIVGGQISDRKLVEARREMLAATGVITARYVQRAGTEFQTSTNLEFYSALRTQEYSTYRDFQNAEIEGVTTVGDTRMRVLLSGLLPDRDLMGIFDRHKVAVVEDDLLSCGRRLLRVAPSESADPWQAVAEDFLALPPCSSIASPVAERLEFLLDMYEHSNAEAIIFHTVKFCEVELFDHPFLVDAIKARHIPVLVLETELHQPQYGQLETRLEAFLEMHS